MGLKIMKIGIKNNKIWDICSELINKRDDSIPDIDYLDLEMGDWFIGDNWDSKNNISLKDSPKRFEKPPKSELELLEEKVLQLEQKIEKLEKK